MKISSRPVELFGLAKADMVKKRNARGKGKEFSKPTVSQIKRYARKKQRDLEGDE